MIPFKYVTFAEMQAQVDITKPVFVDTETNGLYGDIALLQCFQPTWDAVLFIQNPSSLQTYAELSKLHTVWHNNHYDNSVIQKRMPIKLTNIDDTFLLARLAQPQHQEYNLEAVMTRILSFNPYASYNKKAMQKSDWSGTLTKEQEQYAATDVYYLPQVWDVVSSALDEPSYILDKSTLMNCMDMQLSGMPIDHDRAFAKRREIEKELASIHMPVNANSWQQVREWLGGVEESDKIFLSTLALRDGNDKAARVLRVRTLRKLLSFLGKYDMDRLFGYFKPSARSGRLTSDKENLQQIPRALKCIFSAPEGRKLIYSDYAQLELRTIASILGVNLLVQLFREGVDVHGYVASMLFGEDFTKADRQVTKTYNFNLLYGGSVGMVLSILITYGFWIEKRLANRHKAKWLNLFPEINKWQQEQIAAWRKGKLGSTPFGRKYKGKLMTDQMNLKNQGAGAEVAKLAFHYLTPKLKEYNAKHDTDVIICNFIHDSFILECDDNEQIYTDASKLLADCMQRAWFEMSKLYKIKDLPMPIEVLVGSNWGDLENGIDVDYKLELEGMALFNEVNDAEI